MLQSGRSQALPRHAIFVLARLDEILTWEKTKEQERDVRFVELGEYLCEVRSKQYWRLDSATRTPSNFECQWGGRNSVRSSSDVLARETIVDRFRKFLTRYGHTFRY
jgi:hypothetical protein